MSATRSDDSQSRCRFWRALSSRGEDKREEKPESSFKVRDDRMEDALEVSRNKRRALFSFPMFLDVSFERYKGEWRERERKSRQVKPKDRLDSAFQCRVKRGVKIHDPTKGFKRKRITSCFYCNVAREWNLPKRSSFVCACSILENSSIHFIYNRKRWKC